MVDVHVSRAVTTSAPANRSTAIADLERGLTVQCVKNVLVAVPIGVALWIGIVAACISFTTAGYSGPLAMGAGVGVLAGVFFGTWAAFVSYGPRFDDETREPRA